MDERKDLGKAGEQIAVDLLISKGFAILERNWHFSHKEIDIIARDHNDIVVIEVKTRNAPKIYITQLKAFISATPAKIKIARVISASNIPQKSALCS